MRKVVKKKTPAKLSETRLIEVCRKVLLQTIREETERYEKSYSAIYSRLSLIENDLLGKPRVDPDRRERIATATLGFTLASRAPHNANPHALAGTCAVMSVLLADALIAELDK